MSPRSNPVAGLLRRTLRVLLAMTLTFNLQALAYSSSDGTIVVNKRHKRKALLDYKFVIMQGKPQEAFTPDHNTTDSKGLRTISTAPRQIPAKAPSKKPLALSKTVLEPVREETWDDYAEEVEMDEELGVSAKIRQ